ncbi:MAG: TIGR02569 family protein [Actinomycetota bacterium]|nr:TIGR02569 family protein [Actinomycetota bacterium]
MSGPSAEVVAAFGWTGADPRLLAGGQGGTWLAGDIVLKLVDNVDEHTWVSNVLAGLGDGATLRTPTPLRSVAGTWSFGGWSAHRYVAGETLSMATDAPVIRSAGEAFHAQVSHLARPALLDRRDDPWAFGDRVAWEGAAASGSPETRELVEAAMSAYRPVLGTSQPVHGDLAGNVLGGPGLVPAVIDWPPYWRPAGWSLAVAAVDGVCWDGAPPSIFDDWADVEEWDQMLLRALVYRVATVGRTEHDGHPKVTPLVHADRVRPVLECVLGRI